MSRLHCVRYTADDGGNINFLPSTTPAPSLWRMTLAAASMTLALLTGCTDSTPDEVHEDRCVYEFGPWGFTAARGEGSCPAVDEPEEQQMLGMISIEPVSEPVPEPVPVRVKQSVRMGKIAIHEPEPEPVLVPVVVEPEPQIRMGDVSFDPEPETNAPGRN